MQKWAFGMTCVLMVCMAVSVFAAPEMILVKAGSFQIGNTRDDSEGDDNEKPVHRVTLTYDYWIGKYEVTFDEYDVFCDATGKSKPHDGPAWAPTTHWGRGTHPAFNVTWNDAIAYCNWLSQRESLKPAYDSEGHLLNTSGSITNDVKEVEGYRLPTEAEWEYAARGGHKSEVDYKYAGSDSIDEVAWYWDNWGETNWKTQPVGGKAPNELGLYDMSGNVWEWCYDWYADYTTEAENNPIGPSTGSYRVLRSGRWNYHAQYCRVSYRDSWPPDNAQDSLGFRISRTIF